MNDTFPMLQLPVILISSAFCKTFRSKTVSHHIIFITQFNITITAKLIHDIGGVCTKSIYQVIDKHGFSMSTYVLHYSQIKITQNKSPPFRCQYNTGREESQERCGEEVMGR